LSAFANPAVFMILINSENNSYESLTGLLVIKPFIAFCFRISVLSLAGIPPFGVLWGKFMTLNTAFLTGYWCLALFVAFSSVLILYTFFQILIYFLFFQDLVIKLSYKWKLYVCIQCLVEREIKGRKELELKQ
ncbi:proton-conducting transporter membrane subunit, partial [Campylobacter jejuni]